MTSKVRVQPVAGVVLVVLGILMVAEVLRLEQLLGVAAIVVGALFLLNEFT